MKTTSRILSIVLAVTMLVGLMPMAAFAAEAAVPGSSTVAPPAPQDPTAAPEPSAAPEAPVVPDTPAVPDAPAAPDAPAVPDVPAAPDAPAAPNTPGSEDSKPLTPVKEIGQASVTMEGWTFGESAKQPVVESATNAGVTAVITYAPKGSDSYKDRVPVNAGTYTVKVVYGETDTHTEAVATADFTISKATVTEIALGDVSFLARAYNGSTALTVPDGSQLPVAFTVGKEDLAPAMDHDYEAALTLTDAKPDTDPNSSNAVLTVTLKDSGNFVLESDKVNTELSFHVDITKPKVTITAKDQVLPMGTDITDGLEQVTVSGAFAAGDSLAAITLTEDENGVITPSAAQVKNGSTDSTANYDITYVSGKAIRSAAVTQAPAAHGNLVYNGSEQELLAAGTAERGTMEYRLDSAADWSSEIPTAKDAGEYKIYYRAKGENSFGDSVQADLTVTISPKSIAATASAEKPYDGKEEADSCIKIQVPADAFGKDDVTLEGTVGSKFASAAPGQHNVTPGTVTLSGASAKNYTVIVAPFTGTIQNPDTPVVTAAPTPAEGLVYNGQPQELLANKGEAVGGTIWYRAKGIDWRNTPLSATPAGTYIIEYQVVKIGAAVEPERVDGTVTVTIAPKPLTATATAKKVYDGNVFTNTADISFKLNRDGVVGNDQVEIQDIKDSTFERANAGTDIPVSAGHVVLIGEDAGNYEVNVTQFTGEITRKPITVTAPTLSKRYGQVDPTIQPSARDLVGRDKLVGQIARAEGEDAGVYALSQGTVTNENNPNYDITFQDGKLTVHPAKSAMKIKLSRTSAVAGRDVTITVTAVNGEENLMTENWKQPDAPRLLVGSTDLKLEATDTEGVWKCTYRVPKDAKGSLVFNASDADDTGNYLAASEVSAKLKIGTSTSPLTGDQQNPMLYAAIAIISAALIVLLFFYNKKKNPK